MLSSRFVRGREHCFLLAALRAAPLFLRDGTARTVFNPPPLRGGNRFFLRALRARTLF
jgi:hypothetical protein